MLCGLHSLKATISQIFWLLLDVLVELHIWLSTSRILNRIWNSSITMVMKLKLHTPTGDSTDKSSRKHISAVLIIVLEQWHWYITPMFTFLFPEFMAEKNIWQQRVSKLHTRKDSYLQLWGTPNANSSEECSQGMNLTYQVSVNLLSMYDRTEYLSRTFSSATFFAPNIDLMTFQFYTLKTDSGFSHTHWSTLRIKTAYNMEYLASVVMEPDRIDFLF